MEKAIMPQAPGPREHQIPRAAPRQAAQPSFPRVEDDVPWAATRLEEAIEKKPSEIECQIERSQAAVSDLLEASPVQGIRFHAHTVLQRLTRNLGTDVEIVRMMKRNLEDSAPDTTPHLGGVSDRL